jgi:mannose-1-phosphate guanylyltransferase
MITQAFVLAAGMGKRLRPLTDDLPKPLVPIFHKPLITFALDHLISAGVQSFVINTHRLPETFTGFFARDQYAGHSVRLLYEPDLLETGGGIKNAEPFLESDAFITYSGDILTDVDLRPLLDEHASAGNDVTLALRVTPFAPEIALRDSRIIDIVKKRGIDGNYDFANIAVWNRGIFERIAAGQKVSFIPVLNNWIDAGGKIGGVVLGDGKWFNIGSTREYLEVHRMIARERWKPSYVCEADWPQAISKRAQVDPTASIAGCSAVDDQCRVAANVKLIDTILWPGAQIARGSQLRNCIVRSGKVAEGTLENVIV